tara:strand:+ start:64 stop:282 length:219 start_codon:yes stop_codon:yes gene_type:complete
MTNKLLGIIAINLTIITGLMVLQAIPTVEADEQGIDWYSLRYDYGFKSAVRNIVNSNCSVSGSPDWGYTLSC